MPYGEVISWRADISEEDFKTERNVTIEKDEVAALYKEGTQKIYVAVIIPVTVVNKGAEGILTFHAVCHLDTLNNKNQDSVNTTLRKNQEGSIRFWFWVNVADIPDYETQAEYDSWSKQAFTVQAVNLFVED